MTKIGLPKVCVNVIEDMHKGMSTKLMSLYEKIEEVSVSVRVHYVSASTFYLYSLVMNEIT